MKTYIECLLNKPSNPRHLYSSGTSTPLRDWFVLQLLECLLPSLTVRRGPLISVPKFDTLTCSLPSVMSLRMRRSSVASKYNSSLGSELCLLSALGIQSRDCLALYVGGVVFSGLKPHHIYMQIPIMTSKPKRPTNAITRITQVKLHLALGL